MELTLFINLFVGNIFLSTGFSKCFNLIVFEEAMTQFTNFRNPKFIWFISRAVVVMEISCGGLLICSIFYKVAAILLMVLLAIFSVLIVFHLNKKTNLTCHCGGALGNEAIHIGIPVRNLILIIGLLFAIIAPEIPFILQLWFEIEHLKIWLLTELLVLCLLVTYYFSLKLNALTRG
ncbi:DoxX family membrane protein [Paenibacillus sp. N3/727]|uniref:MauE/DoxX family redox-associated membrane protein n=1 Tax=Paenibacillus sp. N3/727 TaxID=2925845 RepID=UPI001F5364E1|nr:MauE/DoxX family redox-associated membrane protein [Paenibacillus sp. N3/727]UNK20357.1 DoxX family membrane protein [Paenibacillus sp. N3/727]